MTKALLKAEGAYAALYGGLFMSLGAQIAFLTIWMEGWGLSAAEIGRVHALAVAVRIVTGAGAPALADRLGRPRAVMVAVALAGGAAAAMLALAGSRLEIYLLVTAMAVAYAALIPLGDAHGFASAERLGFSYRRARSVGSFTFLAATFLCGVTVQSFGASATLWWLSLPLLIAALGAWGAPIVDMRGDGHGESGERLRGADPPPKGWMTARPFLLFMLAAAAIQSSHGVYYVYGSLHWRDLGYSEGVIGALWSWAVLVEIGVFFAGAGLMRRLGAVGALLLAAAAAALRWGAMSLDPPFAAVIALQALHGVTFGLTHLGALAFLHATAPPGRIATAQGLLSATGGGIGMLLITLGASALFPAYGGGAYLLGALFGAIGLAASFGLWTATRADKASSAAEQAQPQSARSGGNMTEPL